MNRFHSVYFGDVFSGVFLFIILIAFFALSAKAEVIITDSKMTFDEAINGTKAPKKIIENLRLIDVQYYSFDYKLHQGQLVIHKDLVEDVYKIFELMRKEKFPIAKCIPIVKYNWSDNASMEDNNTSGFNYRKVANSNKLSNHSYGFAVDFNPFQNPAVYLDGKISPKGSKYEINDPGTITSDCFITLELKKLGWTWGGDWNSLKDYQHFQKIVE
ncbi:MAG: hypothetical protein A2X64_06335 [Ignavibacteria bacterium GWF2_33_9]|nr:MAG: hypothetical protein A2X64_06335 [Ignavibacteria bacterium GWF2_33_9]